MSFGQTNELIIKVIDQGPGLAVLGQTPSGNVFIFDTGHPSPDSQKVVQDTIEQISPPGSIIDFIVISHIHDDHLGSLPFLLKNYQVKKLYRTGQERTEKRIGYQRAKTAINDALEQNEIIDYSVSSGNLKPGLAFELDGIQFQFLSAFEKPPSDWKIPESKSHFMLNSASLVMKITYKKKSVLIMGDAIGVDVDNNNYEDAWATEAYLLNKWQNKLRSDVLIAGHHCDNDASSLPFLKIVAPSSVICSAGHSRNRPHIGAISRMLASGISAENIYRTDKGDSELGKCLVEEDRRCTDYADSQEWNHLADKQIIDPLGDDTITVIINSEGLAIKQ